ncbi:putative phospholipid-transporting ATPase VD [Crotalus adamanteus]|uniref:Phospholipid-transporting ATPase VD n=1 Tax=Crotalus adamanteus TaxID=8729 RepID=A0AAW1AQN8_CROAD
MRSFLRPAVACSAQAQPCCRSPVEAFRKEITMIPLCVVLTIIAVKDGLEDYTKYKLDKKINNFVTRAYCRKAKDYVNKFWSDVAVGDFIRLSCNEEIPADMILIYSSDGDGICHLETSSLDGETNLKQRQVVKGFAEQISERYSENVDQERVGLNKDNLLMRGCIVRNTEAVVGIVVYAGHLRWLSASKRPPLYASGKELPVELGGFLMFWTMIILLQVLIPISLYVSIEFVKLGQIFLIRNDLDLYDEASDRKIQCGSLNIAEDLGQIEYIFSDKTGTLTENKMVFRRCSIAGLEYGHEENAEIRGAPLRFHKPRTARNTAVFSPQLAKRLETYQDYEEEDEEAAYFSSHSSLRHAARPRFFSHRSSEFLNSRILQKTSSMGLGSWRHLAFSSPLETDVVPDMRLLKKVNRISSRAYSYPGKQKLIPEIVYITEFFIALAICNTVVVSEPDQPRLKILDTLEMPAGSPSPKKPDILRLPEDRPDRLSYESLNIPEICYEAESPDEAALVHAARAYQCTLKARSPEQVQIDFASLGMLTFQLLHLLPFDSVRKRMSVVVKHPMLNQVVVYTKGADATIMNLLDLGLTGATGIEDRLQEGVPETIAALRKAGINIWMLTGDKKETAINIAYSCKLLDGSDKLFTLDSENLETCALKAKSILEEIGIRTGTPKLGNTPGTAASAMSFALIINGPTLDFALNKRVKDTFMQLARKVRAVICCRATPLQKSKMVKEAQKELQVMTLAVGTPQLEKSPLELPQKLKRPCPASSSRAWAAGAPERGILTPRRPAASSLSGTERRESGVRCLRSALASLFSLSLRSPPTFKRCPPLGERDRRLSQSEGRVFGAANQRARWACRKEPARRSEGAARERRALKQVRSLGWFPGSRSGCHGDGSGARGGSSGPGDGANDVSMIQVADIGIGISGQEGMQAVLASDFAISQFQHLRKLLFVHGHWCYTRLANMILYFFYKNVAYVNLLFWYQFFCGFSGTPAIDYWSLIFFNLLFTSVPPVIYGVLDKDVSAETLLNHPELYKASQKDEPYVGVAFAMNLVDAFYQSLVCFFICYFTFQDSDVDIYSFGNRMNTTMLFIILLHLLIESKNVTVIHFSVFGGSIFLYFLILGLLGAFCVLCNTPANPYWIIQRQLMNPTFYLDFMIAVTLALLPRFLFRVIETTAFPSPLLQARIREHQSHAQQKSGQQTHTHKST